MTTGYARPCPAPLQVDWKCRPRRPAALAWRVCGALRAVAVYVALECYAGFKLRAKALETYPGRKSPERLKLVLQSFELIEPQDQQDLPLRCWPVPWCFSTR